jgi:hypothetical protein
MLNTRIDDLVKYQVANSTLAGILDSPAFLSLFENASSPGTVSFSYSLQEGRILQSTCKYVQGAFLIDYCEEGLLLAHPCFGEPVQLQVSIREQGPAFLVRDVQNTCLCNETFCLRLPPGDSAFLKFNSSYLSTISLDSSALSVYQIDSSLQGTQLEAVLHVDRERLVELSRLSILDIDSQFD